VSKGALDRNLKKADWLRAGQPFCFGVKNSVVGAKSTIRAVKSPKGAARSTEVGAKSSIDGVKSSNNEAKSRIIEVKSAAYEARNSIDAVKSRINDAFYNAWLENQM
jgi:hypothetical protein